MLIGIMGHKLTNRILSHGASSCTLCMMLALSGCTGASTHEFNNRATLSNPDKVLAFVGKKISITEFDPHEEDPETPGDGSELEIVVVIMDAAYQVRYRILELVHGDFEEKFVDFEAYDHYGRVAFSKNKIALIYLSEHDGALYHIKYQYDDVYPTRGGRYAGCGDPYQRLMGREKVDRRPLLEINFSSPVIFQISDHLVPDEGTEYASPEEAKKINKEVRARFSSPVFEVDGDRATCKLGVYSDELFRIKYESMFLPAKRFDLCMQKLQFKHYYPSGPEEQETADACMADLKKAGLP